VARPLRIEYPGAFYHLTSRENNRDIWGDGETRPLKDWGHCVGETEMEIIDTDKEMRR